MAKMYYAATCEGDTVRLHTFSIEKNKDKTLDMEIVPTHPKFKGKLENGLLTRVNDDHFLVSYKNNQDSNVLYTLYEVKNDLLIRVWQYLGPVEIGTIATKYCHYKCDEKMIYLYDGINKGRLAMVPFGVPADGYTSCRYEITRDYIVVYHTSPLYTNLILYGNDGSLICEKKDNRAIRIIDWLDDYVIIAVQNGKRCDLQIYKRFNLSDIIGTISIECDINSLSTSRSSRDVSTFDGRCLYADEKMSEFGWAVPNRVAYGDLNKGSFLTIGPCRSKSRTHRHIRTIGDDSDDDVSFLSNGIHSKESRF